LLPFNDFYAYLLFYSFISSPLFYHFLLFTFF
jgi:hypothetical protein